MIITQMLRWFNDFSTQLIETVVMSDGPVSEDMMPENCPEETQPAEDADAPQPEAQKEDVLN